MMVEVVTACRGGDSTTTGTGTGRSPGGACSSRPAIAGSRARGVLTETPARPAELVGPRLGQVWTLLISQDTYPSTHRATAGSCKKARHS
jgi:hypothetical protein